MSARGLFLALVVVLATTACDVSPVVDADVVLENVAVIPMTSETALEGQTVLIKDGMIVALAPTDGIEPDDDALIIDGEGKFLIPGLADMHVHVWAESELPLYVANGVTLVRNMWGEPETLAMRRRVEAGEILGPRIVTAGRLTDGDPPIWGEASAVATTADQVRSLMDEQKSAGYDFFKIYSHISRETFDEIAAYSREIGFPFAGHVPDAVDLDHALSSGMATIEHLLGWGGCDASTRRPAQGLRGVCRSGRENEESCKCCQADPSGRSVMGRGVPPRQETRARDTSGRERGVARPDPCRAQEAADLSAAGRGRVCAP